MRVEGSHFVLKGDNNSFRDAEHPAEEQIVGSLWVSAPAVGRVTEWLREPLHSAILVGLVTLIALGGGLGTGAAVRRGAQPRTAKPRLAELPRAPRRVPEELKPLLIGLGVAAVVCTGLAFISFGRPLTATETVEAAYAHQGRFEYDARVPRSAAYPDGQVSTGEPVFQRLVHRLRVNFTYRLESEQPVTAGGRIALDARISDGRGWERTLPLAAERPFTDGDATVSGVLDLERLQRITDEVRDLTGSAQTAYTVAVLPRVDVAGSVGREKVDATFAPVLSFDTGDLRLQPKLQAGEGVGPFAPREPGTGTRLVPAEVSLGALSLSVVNARRVSLLGIAALLLLGGVVLAAGRRRPRRRRARADPRSLRAVAPSRLLALGRLGARDRARGYRGARAPRRAPGQADPPAQRGERSLVRRRGREHRVSLQRAGAGARHGDRLAPCRARPSRTSMRPARLARFAVVGAACGLVLVSALAATNTVSASRAGRNVTSITADQKKPKPDCNGITVTAIVTGGANGGNADELVLGRAAADANLRGMSGNDCIVGGGGNDMLRGDNGIDVCIGGPGADTFHATCETQIQ